LGAWVRLCVCAGAHWGLREWESLNNFFHSMFSNFCSLYGSFFSRSARKSAYTNYCVSCSFIQLVMLLPHMNKSHVSLSHSLIDDLTLRVPLAWSQTTSHCSSAITLSCFARVNSRLRSTPCPLTHSYVMSMPRHQFSCKSLIVLTRT
jgi:hypothetical protein